MELYTLTSKFLPKESVNELTSAIWTERYSTAGDVQLVVPATPDMVAMLAPGTFLGLRGTMEIMQLETQSVEEGLLTVTGSSIVKYLNERQAWFKNAAFDDVSPPDLSVARYAELTSDTMTAGQLISQAVYQTVIAPASFGAPWTEIDLDWAADEFPGLILGDIDDNGSVERFSIPLGPLYDGIQRLAQDEAVGLKLYLRSASYDSGFVFKFATYRGKDRTSDQSTHQMVRLTPKMDALTDVKELNSIAQYKNVYYVQYKDPSFGNAISTHYIPGLPVPTGFNRRTILIQAEDIYLDSAAKIAAYRAQTARNAMANQIYIQAIDGNVSAKIPYVFGVDYYLGDVVELQGYTEVFSKARVTEYIRSMNQFGDSEYPTLAVLDPNHIGTIPDTEPDEDIPEWIDDPDFILDADDDPSTDPEHTRERRRKRRRRPGSGGGDDPADPNPEPDSYYGPEADFTWEIE